MCKYMQTEVCVLGWSFNVCGLNAAYFSMTLWVCACDSSKLKLLATIACVPTVSKPGLGCLECWTYGCAFTVDWLVWGLRLSFFWEGGLSFLYCHLENGLASEPCSTLNIFMLQYMTLFKYDFAFLPIFFCSVVLFLFFFFFT